jgi:hypothetical protein
MNRDFSSESVPAIRLFGTTWARRGWRYWWRRFWIAVFCTLVAALQVSIAVGIWSSLVDSASGRPAKIAISAVFGLMVFGGIIWAAVGWWRVLKLQRNGDIAALRAIVNKSGSNRKKGAAAGSLLGIGGLAGFPAAALGLLVGTFAALGWVFVIMLMSYGRYYTIEEYLAVHELKRIQS